MTKALVPLSARPADVTTSPVLDPSDLGPIHGLPLVPARILRQHQVFISADTRFRAAARLLQALWREDRDLPIGFHRDPKGKRRKLGSRISDKAGQAGGNFLHPGIAAMVERELIYREVGAVYDHDRLRTNLLSSQPLVFNIFAPLKHAPDFATRVVQELVPGFMDKVTDIRFEHAPARGHPAFTADHTAFDLLIRGRNSTGQRAFIAVEVKYSESCQEPLPRFSGRYDEIAATSGLFVQPDDPALRRNPVQQLFRQHCLAQVMVDRGLHDVALHLFTAPESNHLAQGAARLYAAQLAEPAPGKVPFMAVTLERVIEAIAAAGSPEHARALHRRYTDFWLIDGELQLGDEPQDPEVSTDAPAEHAADDKGAAEVS
jgi:hypothetical protein